MRSEAARALDVIRGPLSTRPDLSCGQSVLEAFGVPFPANPLLSRFGAGLASCLQGAGFYVDRIELPMRPRPTLTRFIVEHPAGDWVIATAGHVMALRGGVLTDMDNYGTGLRRVQLAYIVLAPAYVTTIKELT